MRKFIFIMLSFAMLALTAGKQTEVLAMSDDTQLSRVELSVTASPVLKMSIEEYRTLQELQLGMYTKLGLSEQEAFKALINSMEVGTPIAVPMPLGFTDPKVCCVDNPADCWPYGICCWRC